MLTMDDKFLLYSRRQENELKSLYCTCMMEGKRKSAFRQTDRQSKERREWIDAFEAQKMHAAENGEHTCDINSMG